MKPKEKIWRTEYQSIDIMVRNVWDFESTREEIRINGKQVYYREIPMAEVSLKSIAGLRMDYVENDTEITVKVGSAWHLCGMACQILINGKHYYGNRIVLFADK
ncbi:hypothetical protein [Neisseria weixii]|uniref:hypothetical protein n=1 Tax=Neisseria weixii TaxID=1853276 RepID=UPI0035A02DBB